MTFGASQKSFSTKQGGQGRRSSRVIESKDKTKGDHKTGEIPTEAPKPVLRVTPEDSNRPGAAASKSMCYHLRCLFERRLFICIPLCGCISTRTRFTVSRNLTANTYYLLYGFWDVHSGSSPDPSLLVPYPTLSLAKVAHPGFQSSRVTSLNPSLSLPSLSSRSHMLCATQSGEFQGPYQTFTVCNLQTCSGSYTLCSGVGW